MKEKTAIIFNIQKFCIHDGPGIRTTVFLKGCNMRCVWCHNPESFKMTPQLSVNLSKCIGCRKCADICNNDVHIISDKHEINFSKCIGCGKCADGCITDAITIIGKQMTVSEVMKEILKDKKYYETSNGGVTISGGEPTMQFDFLLDLLKECKANGIHTAVETNGTMSKEHLETLKDCVDLFLFDYKMTDKDLLFKYTKGNMNSILENLELLKDSNVLIRCPVIPGINDNDAHFEAIKELSKTHPVEIMPYHDIGKQKWQNIGCEYTLKDLKSVSKDIQKEWTEKISQ